MEITKDLTIKQVLDYNRGLARVFMDFGMHCLYCPGASGETLQQASQVHGVDLDELLAQLEAADCEGR